MSLLESIKKDPEIFSRVHTRFSGINKLKPIQLQEIFLLPKVELIAVNGNISASGELHKKMNCLQQR
jgi:hypothetical protein